MKNSVFCSALLATANLVAGYSYYDKYWEVSQERSWDDMLSNPSNPYTADIYRVVSPFTQWELPVYRVRKEVTKEYPVFIQHGAGMDSESWLGFTDWMTVLADAGYDVYLGNNSGNDLAKYVGDGSPKESWEFNFTDMGMSDVPAMIDLALDKSNADKVTYIGYSQGTSQMFYGLANMEAYYYGERINRFIALAPCVVPMKYFKNTKKINEYFFGMMDVAMVYNSEGPDRVQVEQNKQAVCYAFGKNSKECKTFNENPYESSQSLFNIMYYAQLGQAKKFQEPIGY